MSDVATLAELLKLQGTLEVQQTIENVADFGSEEASQQLHIAMLRASMQAGQVLMQFLLADSWRYCVQARYEWRHLGPGEYSAVVILEVADAETRLLPAGILEAVAETVRARMSEPTLHDP